MASKTLLAATATVTLLANAAWAQQQPMPPTAYWQRDQNYTVAQTTLDGYGAICMLKAFVTTSPGYAAWLLTVSTKEIDFAYQETAITWNGGGRMWVQIDQQNSHYFDTTLTPPDLLGSQLILGDTAAEFFKELKSGTTMSITTAAGTRTFPLAGTPEALQNLDRCVGALKAPALPPVAQQPPSAPPAVSAHTSLPPSVQQPPQSLPSSPPTAARGNSL